MADSINDPGLENNGYTTEENDIKTSPEEKTAAPVGDKKQTMENPTNHQAGFVNSNTAASEQDGRSLLESNNGDIKYMPDGQPNYVQASNQGNISRQSSIWTLPQSVTSKISSSNAISVKVPTEKQKKVLAGFSSVNYSPTHSVTYMQWLKEHPLPKFQADRWTLLTIIALTIGLVAWLQKQSLELLDKWKWDKGKSHTREDEIWLAFGWVAFLASIYIISGSFLVVFIHQPAAGSGVPEVISFLNGVIVHGTLTLKNLIVKFFANVLAVSSGIPCAIQGPMIAMGAVIAPGIGQFRSRTLRINPKIAVRFRNAEDRRSYTTTGVAAGVAAAFNAPIGGLLFAMEDLSSFWSRRLCWQTFYTAGIAAITTNLLNYAFTGFYYDGGFGLLKIALTEPIQLHIAVLIPAIVVGLLGGLIGALFTQLNAAIVKTRAKLLAKISNRFFAGGVRITEVLILALIMVAAAVWLPEAFGCHEEQLYPNQTRTIQKCYFGIREGFTIDIEAYNCPEPTDNSTVIYNEVATMLQGSGTKFLDQLWARGTHRWFSYGPLLTVLVIWFFMACWACGSALAGGIFIPNMVTGALYGRIVGLAMMDIYEAVTGDPYPVGTDWDWMDPGLIAVIGSGSMLGGVTRLCLAVTVIVVEMSEDIDLTVPIMLSIFTAKIIADLLSKPLYKYQLKGKMLPYLDPEPDIQLEGNQINLELFKVKDVMTREVATLHATESVATLAKVLVDTEHGGFPVVKYDDQSRREVAYGFITRTELYILLCSQAVYVEDKIGSVITPKVLYEEISVDYISDPSFVLERVRSYSRFPVFQNIFVDLEAYINVSAAKVDEDYSLLRGYMMFRSMGLRHLVVIDIRNKVTGIITRKDLMKFNVENHIAALADEDQTGAGASEHQLQPMNSEVKQRTGFQADTQM